MPFVKAILVPVPTLEAIHSELREMIESIEAEYGTGKTVEQLSADNDLPAIYVELTRILSTVK